MKIKMITHYWRRLPGQRDDLSNKCEERDKFIEGRNIKVGSQDCHDCPLFWFRFRNFVICRKKKLPLFQFFLGLFFGGFFVFSGVGRPLLPPSFITAKASFLYIPAEPIYRNGFIPLRCNLLLIASDDTPSAWAISNTVIPSMPIIINQISIKDQVVNSNMWQQRNYIKVCHFDPFYCVIMTHSFNIGTFYRKKIKNSQKELDEYIGIW